MPAVHHMAKYRTCRNAFDFAADLEKAAQVLGLESAREVAISTSLELHGKITLGTPVKSGRARANWFMAEGAPRTDTTESTTPAQPPTLTGKSVIFITNSLPYIVPLEYGHSRRAPHGMVRRAIAEVLASLKLGKAT